MQFDSSLALHSLLTMLLIPLSDSVITKGSGIPFISRTKSVSNRFFKASSGAAQDLVKPENGNELVVR